MGQISAMTADLVSFDIHAGMMLLLSGRRHTNPCARTPRVTEVHNEEPDHGYGTPTSTRCGANLPLGLVRGKDSGDNNVASSHANSTDDKDGLTAELVNVGDGREGGNPHDDTDNTGGKEGCCVTAEAEVLEDSRGVVQDSVDTLICSSAFIVSKHLQPLEL